VASNFHDQRLKVAVPAIGLRGLSLNASLIGNGEGAMRLFLTSFCLLTLPSSSHSSLHCTAILVVLPIPSERHVFRFTLFLKSLPSALFDFHLCCDFQFTTFPPDYRVEILRFGHISPWTLPAVQGPPIITHP
jgi:hypothetical protein